MARLRPAVFLDRDGVLNELITTTDSHRSPRSVDELVIVADCAALLGMLRRAGYELIVVTNQPEIARGAIPAQAVDDISATLESVLPIRAVYCCPHDTPEQCMCRKPRPGMLISAAHDHALDLERSWLIGDRWVDIAAARAAGLRSVLLERPWSWDPTSSGAPPFDLGPDARAADLGGAVSAVLDRLGQKS
jgi:D-glycero-D-manno-heptose 1,7-bisphosphate phosphatase